MQVSMPQRNAFPQSLPWYRRAPWLILVGGLVLALVVTALLFTALMQPPLAELRALVTTLGVTSVLSLGLGYLLYRRGWARSTSLARTLVLTYLWAALLAIINVGILQRQMFVSEHDLILSGILLLFAAIIATAFGVFISASVTDDLRHLAHTAQLVARGDLSARVTVRGRDEVALVGNAFNDMATQLQAVESQRAELDQLRRDLIAWASHDLRTPLTSIRVRVEALNDGLVGDERSQKRFYTDILADAVALNELIDDLLELAQLEAGGMKLEFVEGSLSEVIQDCTRRLRPLADQRGVSIVVHVDTDIDPIRLSEEKIRRVVDNLLSNALRYAPEGGRVWVKASRTPDGALLVVEDNGPGFNEADLPRLFEQFYRGEQARSRSTGGAGLGLAIARGIIEAHAGRIWAENRAEGGARVTFLLPHKRLAV